MKRGYYGYQIILIGLKSICFFCKIIIITWGVEYVEQWHETIITQIGEMIDGKDPKMGAWFEAKIVDISLADENNPSSILYHVVFDGYVKLL